MRKIRTAQFIPNNFLIHLKNMGARINPGDCVEIPDGRTGRVREKISGGKYKIRVRRRTSESHQFLELKKSEIKKIDCPKGWMSPDGFNKYLKTTLQKMRERNKKKQSKNG
jgi:hypothetical protein